MLLMTPKPTIEEAKLTRKRYLITSLIYHQLERKGHDVYIEEEEYNKRLEEFLQSDKNKINMAKIVRETELSEE